MAEQPEIVLTVLPGENFRATPCGAFVVTKAGEKDARKEARGVNLETAKKMFAYWGAILTAKKVDYVHAKIQDRADKLTTTNTPCEGAEMPTKIVVVGD